MAGLLTTLGVLADTHIPDRVPELNPKITQVFHQARVSAILHGGDVTTPRVITELEQIAPVYAVRGNRDIFYLRNLPLQVKLNIEGVSIGMAHGHGTFTQYMVDMIHHSIQGIVYKKYLTRMLQTYPDMDVIIFGHIHVPFNILIDGKLLFNPGSTSSPALPGAPATFGLLHLEYGKVPRGEIVELGG